MRRQPKKYTMLIAAAEKLGVAFVEFESRKKHNRLVFRKGGRDFFLVVSASASDRRAGHNQIASLKRTMNDLGLH